MKDYKKEKKKFYNEGGTIAMIVIAGVFLMTVGLYPPSPRPETVIPPAMFATGVGLLFLAHVYYQKALARYTVAALMNEEDKAYEAAMAETEGS